MWNLLSKLIRQKEEGITGLAFPSTNLFYILDDAGNPAPVADATVWARWFETANRTVGLTQLETGDPKLGDYEISTIFLGVAHGFMEGLPVLFETLLFHVDPEGTRRTIYSSMRRYTTREMAIRGHQEVVEVVDKFLTNPVRLDELTEDTTPRLTGE